MIDLLIILALLGPLALYAALTGDWYGIRWLGLLILVSGGLAFLDRRRQTR